MTFRELCRKQVIQMESGAYLGHIDDLVINPKTSAVERYVLFGRPRFFGLLGREEDLSIPFGDIARFGVDTLLITTRVPEQDPEARRRFSLWQK